MVRERSVSFEYVFRLVDRAMGNLSRGQVLATALVGVGVVAVPAYLLGSEISLSLLYLCPVGIATWYAGSKSGTVVAVISTLSVVAGEFGDGDLLNRPWIAAWNAVLHLGFMLVVAYLLDRLRVHFAIEQRLANSDPLTGVLNARAFTEQLQARLDLAAREENPITVAYLDLDDFKRVNDRGGHVEGDRVLRLVASTLTQAIRRTDLLARVGGDEFALLISGADSNAVEQVISKLRNALNKAFVHERLAITCSIGCVTFQAPLPSAEDAIHAADSLMYEVKNDSKNAVAFEVFDYQTGKAAKLAAAADAPLTAHR